MAKQRVKPMCYTCADKPSVQRHSWIFCSLRCAAQEGVQQIEAANEWCQDCFDAKHNIGYGRGWMDAGHVCQNAREE